MKYFLVILSLVMIVIGGELIEIGGTSLDNSQRYDRISSNSVPSENARIFSQEEPFFPTRYFYPTYPEYVDMRYQNGYNGALVKVPAEQPISSWGGAWTKLIPISSFALLYGAKAGIFLFSVLLILILGLVFTTTICTFTPICTISFPGLDLTKNQIKEQVAELARNYITPESLNAATVLVQEAVDKYTKIQSEEDKKETTINQPSSTSIPQLPILTTTKTTTTTTTTTTPTPALTQSSTPT